MHACMHTKYPVMRSDDRLAQVADHQEPVWAASNHSGINIHTLALSYTYRLNEELPPASCVADMRSTLPLRKVCSYKAHALRGKRRRGAAKTPVRPPDPGLVAHSNIARQMRRFSHAARLHAKAVSLAHIQTHEWPSRRNKAAKAASRLAFAHRVLTSPFSRPSTRFSTASSPPERPRNCTSTQPPSARKAAARSASAKAVMSCSCHSSDSEGLVFAYYDLQVKRCRAQRLRKSRHVLDLLSTQRCLPWAGDTDM